MERVAKFHIIISVDAENVFHHVAGTSDVNAIGRDAKLQRLVGFVFDVHFEGAEDGFHHIAR